MTVYIYLYRGEKNCILSVNNSSNNTSQKRHREQKEKNNKKNNKKKVGIDGIDFKERVLASGSVVCCQFFFFELLL